MVNYSCEKCGKTFKQKGHYMKHLQRKTPCDNIKDKIENIVEKKVDELVKEKLQDLVEKGDIEIKNKNLISNNQINNIKMDKNYKHSKGQYFTKHESLQKCVIDFILNKPSVILEPSIGRGDLVECISNKIDVVFDMCEIDKNIKLLDSIDRTKVIYGDFMETIMDTKYDTIIGNPPYVKTKKGNLYLDFIKKCLIY